MNECVTVDDAIQLLQEAKRTARLGGDTCLVLSLSGSGIENAAVNELAVVNDDDGSVVEVRVQHPDFVD